MQGDTPKPQAVTLDRVLESLDPPPTLARHGLHSPVYEALWAAHDELAPHLNYPRRPDWQHVAAKLAAKGITDGEGKPPSGQTTRKTWWKVRWDKRVVAGQALRRRRRRDRGASPPGPSAPPAAAPKPPDAGGIGPAQTGTPPGAPRPTGGDFDFKFALDDDSN